MESIQLAIAIAVLVSLAIYCWRLNPGRVAKLCLPPGPTLLSGSLPGKDIATTFQKWSREYGPVVSFSIGGRTFIILGTRQAAQDLLEKRGNIYSSRAPSVWMDKYLYKGLAAAFMPYGAEWRLNRRLHGSLLGVHQTNAYRYLQDIQSKYLLHEFLSTDDFSHGFHQYTSNVMFTLVYGKERGRDNGDHRRLEQINDMASFILRGASSWTLLLDLFPILDRLPRFWWTWRTEAATLHDKTKAVYRECCETALTADCWNWSREVTGKRDIMALPWDHVCYSLGELYVAGIHTTKMVLDIFVLVSVLYPTVVSKAQRELDSIVGSDRMPSFDDLDQLPFINAIISELLRWRPISPIAVPHAVMQDDEYMGYFIPRGATIVANQYGMNMDESIFGDPTRFRPERYIENPELPVAAFGFGRRACPGHRLARSSLFIVISRLLWGYDITSADKQGPLESSSPSSVKAAFHVRSPRRQGIIEQDWDLAEKDDGVILDEIQSRFRRT
ncbi:cytochrome P450 [Aspergillus clavatus NRRL 1]|uniref:Cytochrome P450, putative n=1 Tax=Aspergillus clavatus (strain ATCC 1007 / CBS 513.65 / DSM 816 / NCTC 3887 / NRRL 1 / QM 1276 / 107) TaxID=344612 RepID=A1C8X6_ASPCL|nr:cytochrome P450, putative [Aspergillus clavatus NRRL 1]EAW13763.1 cytochrome P450, putative [Aspergillus clavatus NRRL 1]